MPWFFNRKEKTPENTVAAVPQDVRKTISRLKGRAPPAVRKQESVQVSIAQAFPVTPDILKEQAQERKALAKKALKGLIDPSFLIGQLVEDEGVYIGTWAPKDNDGNSLGKTFNVFAAPQDLTTKSGRKATLEYDDTVKRVAELNNWHGFNGGFYETEDDLYKSLKEGRYKGEWFIPTYGLIMGEYKQKSNSLYTHKDKEGLAGTFNTAPHKSGGGPSPDWYWSCTPHKGGPRDEMFFGQFTSDFGIWTEKICLLSCRPVRAVEIKP